MPIKRIDHIAIVVPDIEGALAFYEDALGMHVERVEQVDDQEVLVAFLPAGESELELVEPLNDTSGVAKYMSKRGPGIHHLCMEVDDLEGTLRKLKARKVRLINETPTIGSGGKRIAFIHPESTFGVLVELYESSPQEPGLREMPVQALRKVSVETRAVSAAVSAFVKALRGKKSKTPPALPAKSGGIKIKAEGDNLPE
jgi:methylmalonyl-CoA/ethylmalonyl-CoA epimerase